MCGTHRYAAPAYGGRLPWLLGVAVVVLVVDQATKAWALSSLQRDVRHALWGEALGIQLVFNPGAALGMGMRATWLLPIFAVMAIATIVWISRRLGSTEWAVALGLMLGGALGNLIDRLVRDPGFGRGRVIDFIAYGNLFVGNVADIVIVVAAALLMFLSFRGVRLDGSRA